ncbi:MAG TPA: Ig-like domain-containing protein, partial [Candidatus Dormibacteraeota bacterium]|nr:Ig-like domain-containing protein [Candidatus Dormibacteraeota bacterium]
MKILDRGGVDRVVRGLEADAVGMARAVTGDAGRADAIVLQAFADVAPWFARWQDAERLRQRLHARIQQRTQALAQPNGQYPKDPAHISATLHAQIVDLVEEHQSDEPLGQRKAALAAIAGAAVLSAVVALVWTRFDALASGRPTLTDMTPPPNASEIATQGEVVLVFGRKPSARPSIRLQPADGVLNSSNWDGKTLAVSYRGLRLATRYSIVVAGDYRSRFQDVGHFEQRW